MTILLVITNLLTLIYAATKISRLETTVGMLIAKSIGIAEHIKQIEEYFVGEEE